MLDIYRLYEITRQAYRLFDAGTALHSPFIDDKKYQDELAQQYAQCLLVWRKIGRPLPR
jgi:hypothetical protein